MAKKVILGTDIARDAFKTKVNDNFTELYDKDVALEQQINDLRTDVGDKTTLTTTDKTNLVNAVNETKAQINDLDADFVAHKADYVNSQTVTSIDFPFAIGFEKSSQARVTKIGKFVTVTIGVKKTDNTVFTQGTPIVIGQLPVGYRPLNALIVIAGTNSVEWAIKDAGYVYIATDGGISVTNSVNATAKVFYFNASYIVN